MGAAQFLDTFREFPPRLKPASFSIDQVIEKMEQSFDYGHDRRLPSASRRGLARCTREIGAELAIASQVIASGQNSGVVLFQQYG